MKESAVSEKKAGSVSAKRAKKAASLTRDGLKVADRPLMSIVQRAVCRDCGPSVQSLAGGMMQTPVAQRQAAAMLLQRSRGNKFVQDVAIQAKLMVGPADNEHEREADRVAEQVMRMPEPRVQRSYPKCEKELVRSKSLAGQVMPLVERKASGLARHSEVPAIVHEVLRSPGQPLNAATRAFMEPRFGHDFSSVRVHADAKAAESARAVGALAYTVGRNVIFDSRRCPPDDAKSRRILAHELIHVLQQMNIAQLQSATLEMGTPGDAYEREANTIAAQALSGDGAHINRISKLSVRRMQMQTIQDTHAGLFELAQHDQLGGPTFSPQAQYRVRIEFFPYPVVNCERIAMVQTAVSRVAGALTAGSAAATARSLTAAEGTEGVHIDRLSGRTQPYYGTTNAGAAGALTHFGSRTGAHAPDRAWMQDIPGFSGTAASSRTAGQTLSQHFETCAICTQGTDLNAYYGCVSWGFDIDAHDNFTEAAFRRVSKGTPSADFLAAARRWNAQTTPVATADLPIPGYSTRNEHMRMSEILAEIRTLETRLAGLAPGHADIPQITFDLRVLRDFRDAIRYNENQHYLQTEIRMIQQKVRAAQDGIWGYETIRRVKIWQATHGIRADGRVGSVTLGRMGIHRAGDYPRPDMSETATRMA
jgi:hypothetical protein